MTPLDSKSLESAVSSLRLRVSNMIEAHAAYSIRESTEDYGNGENTWIEAKLIDIALTTENEAIVLVSTHTLTLKIVRCA